VSPVYIPKEVLDIACETHGAFFEPIARIDRRELGRNHLDVSRSKFRASILEKYVPLRGQKLLEIGSGFGTNLASWIKDFEVDGYGVEPASKGFDESYKASRLLFSANGLDPNRIVDASGERLPFADKEFDIVYAANVLEHVTSPQEVLTEAVRVLKPGGILHMEIPNYLSYFEGHYMIPQPPVVSNRFLALWAKFWGRDEAFAYSLKLVNPIWCRKMVHQIGKLYKISLLSMGEDLFLERLSQPYRFETQISAGKLAMSIRMLQTLNFGNWIGKLIVTANGFYPIYLTLRREG
jgi:ubiquinone/menaquinone biosynthesis C-methylase UbiE